MRCHADSHNRISTKHAGSTRRATDPTRISDVQTTTGSRPSNTCQLKRRTGCRSRTVARVQIGAFPHRLNPVTLNAPDEPRPRRKDLTRAQSHTYSSPFPAAGP